MRHFCTYFDQHYLTRGLALYESLRRHCPHFKLWVLCLDEPCRQMLAGMNLPHLVPVALADFERDDAPLLAVKGHRSRFEYYFTCTPSWLLYILRTEPGIEMLTYLDADLFFFADPAPIYDEMGDGSILIIGHRFPEPLLHIEQSYGIYNVGLLAFRNDSHSQTALRWWRERCLEKCSDDIKDGCFADQKYLDDWPTRFPKVVVLQHQGAGLAPWNVARYRFQVKDGRLFVENDPLVFYHFHRLNIVGPWLFETNLEHCGAAMSPVLAQRVYGPYLRMLQRQAQRVSIASGNSRFERPVRTRRDLARLLLYGQSLFACGPLVFKVHLEPIFRPLLMLRRLVLGSRRP